MTGKKLNWACQVVKDGRTFVRRLIDSLSNVNNRNAKILLSSEFFDDIAWRLKFMN
jgi:predicted alpha-1,6-mannanase (GH76 family)